MLRFVIRTVVLGLLSAMAFVFPAGCGSGNTTEKDLPAETKAPSNNPGVNDQPIDPNEVRAPPLGPPKGPKAGK